MDNMYALYLDRASIVYDHYCLRMCSVYLLPRKFWTSCQLNRRAAAMLSHTSASGTPQERNPWIGGHVWLTEARIIDIVESCAIGDRQ